MLIPNPCAYHRLVTVCGLIVCWSQLVLVTVTPSFIGQNDFLFKLCQMSLEIREPLTVTWTLSPPLQ